MRGRERARVLGFVAVVAGCVPGPQGNGTESNGGTTSSGAGATGSSSGGETTTEMVTTGTTAMGTTGGPVMGTWRGFLDRSDVVGFAMTFSDCASQETWGVNTELPVPDNCGLDWNHLYVEVSGVLTPPGEDGPWMWSSLEIAEVLVGPCKEASCEQGASGAICGFGVELCDTYFACDLWEQDCPAGEKCMPYSASGFGLWDSLKCEPVMPGAVGAGEPCKVEGSAISGIDNCEEGHMCWNVDPDTGIGFCVALCAGTPDMPVCPACSGCVSLDVVVLNVCYPECSPLLNDCPAVGDVCVPFQEASSFLCATDASGESGKEFDPCQDGSQCDGGLWCAPPAYASECDPNAPGCCLPFCDVLAPSCPGVGQVCAPWFEMTPDCGKYENLGSCRLPP